MPSIKIRKGEKFESALKRFTKACVMAGIFSDYKKHQYFEKPSERRKNKLAAARRKQRRMILFGND